MPQLQLLPVPDAAMINHTAILSLGILLLRTILAGDCTSVMVLAGLFSIPSSVTRLCSTRVITARWRSQGAAMVPVLEGESDRHRKKSRRC